MAGAALELKVLISVLQESEGLKTLLTDVQTLLQSLKNVDNVSLQRVTGQLRNITDSLQGGGEPVALKVKVQADTSSLETLGKVTKETAAKGQEHLGKFQTQLNALLEPFGRAETAARRTASGMEVLDAAALRVQRAFHLLTGGILAFASVRFLKDIADTAARSEVLGTVLEVVARNSAISAEEIRKVDKEVQRLGITAASSRQSLTQFLQAGLNLEFAPKLARASQDLAVIAGANSSQVFQRMITNIQQLDTVGLRWMGITVSMTEAERRYQQEVLHTTQELTRRQRQQALLNEVLLKSAELEGTYETAMGDVGKQLTSLERYTENLKDALGEGLLPTYLALVEELTQFIDYLTLTAQEMNANQEAAQELGDTVRAWARTIRESAQWVVEHRDTILSIVKAYVALKAVLIVGGWVVGLVDAWAKLSATLKLVHAGTIGLTGAVQLLRAATVAEAQAIVQAEVAKRAAIATNAGLATSLTGVGTAIKGVTALWTGLASLVAIPLVMTIYRVWKDAKAAEVPGTEEWADRFLKIQREVQQTAQEKGVSQLALQKQRIESGVFRPLTAAAVELQYKELKEVTKQVESVLTNPAADLESRTRARKVLEAVQRRTAETRLLWQEAIKVANISPEERAALQSELNRKLAELRPPVISEELLKEIEDTLLVTATQVEGHADRITKEKVKLLQQIQKLEDTRSVLRSIKRTGTAEEVKEAEDIFRRESKRTQDMRAAFDRMLETDKTLPESRRKLEKAFLERAQERQFLKKLREDWMQAEDLVLKGWSFGPGGERQGSQFVQRLGAFRTLLQVHDENVDLLQKGSKDLTVAGKEFADSSRYMWDRIRTALEETAPTAKSKRDLQELETAVGEFRKRFSSTDAQKFADQVLTNARLAVRRAERAFYEPGLEESRRFYQARMDRIIENLKQELSIQKQYDSLEEARDRDAYNRGLLDLDTYYEERINRMQRQGEREADIQTAIIAQLEGLRRFAKVEDIPALDNRINEARNRLILLVGEVEYQRRELTKQISDLTQRRASTTSTQVRRDLDIQLEEAKKRLEVLQYQMGAPGQTQLQIQQLVLEKLELERQMAERVQDIVQETAIAYGGLDAILDQISTKYGRQLRTLVGVQGAVEAIQGALERDQYNATLEFRNRLLQQWWSMEQSILDLQRARIVAAADEGRLTTTQAMRETNSLIQQQIELVQNQLANKREELNSLNTLRKREEANLRQQLITQGFMGAELDKKIADSLRGLDESISSVTRDMNGMQQHVLELGIQIETYGKQLRRVFSESLAQAIADSIKNLKNAGDAITRFGLSIRDQIINTFSRELADRITRAIVVSTSKRDAKTGEILPNTSIFDRIFNFMGLGTSKADGTRAHPYTVVPGPGWEFLIPKVQTGYSLALPGGGPFLGEFVDEIEAVLKVFNNSLFGILGGLTTPPRPIITPPNPETQWNIWNPLGRFFSFKEGGYVYGRGTGTSDSVPARLSAGEYVMPAGATKLWLPLLEALRSPSGFQVGGPVQSIAPTVVLPPNSDPIQRIHQLLGILSVSVSPEERRAAEELAKRMRVTGKVSPVITSPEMPTGTINTLLEMVDALQAPQSALTRGVAALHDRRSWRDVLRETGAGFIQGTEPGRSGINPAEELRKRGFDLGNLGSFAANTLFDPLNFASSFKLMAAPFLKVAGAAAGAAGGLKLAALPVGIPGGAARLRQLLESLGGFSLTATGEMPSTGLFVGQYRNTDPRVWHKAFRELTDDVLGMFWEQNKTLIEKPGRVFGGWRAKESHPILGLQETYLDISRRFELNQLRSATKFGERTRQIAGYRRFPDPEKAGEFIGEDFPIGNWADFIQSPDFATRLNEMARAGERFTTSYGGDWVSLYTTELERIYGPELTRQIGGLLATARSPRVATEYLRRIIRGESLIQPEFRIPTTAVGSRTRVWSSLSGPGHPLPWEKARSSNLVQASLGDIEALQAPAVREEARALLGDPHAFVANRFWSLFTEAPERGVFASTTPGVLPTGRSFSLLKDVVERQAGEAGLSTREYSARVGTGILDTLQEHGGRLYGSTYPRTGLGGARWHYPQISAILREKASRLGISVPELEARLRGGDAELLGMILSTAAGTALWQQQREGFQEGGSVPKKSWLESIGNFIFDPFGVGQNITQAVEFLQTKQKALSEFVAPQQFREFGNYLADIAEYGTLGGAVNPAWTKFPPYIQQELARISRERRVQFQFVNDSLFTGEYHPKNRRILLGKQLLQGQSPEHSKRTDILGTIRHEVGHDETNRKLLKKNSAVYRQMLRRFDDYSKGDWTPEKLAKHSYPPYYASEFQAERHAIQQAPGHRANMSGIMEDLKNIKDWTSKRQFKHDKQLLRRYAKLLRHLETNPTSPLAQSLGLVKSHQEGGVIEANPSKKTWREILAESDVVQMLSGLKDVMTGMQAPQSAMTLGAEALYNKGMEWLEGWRAFQWSGRHPGYDYQKSASDVLRETGAGFFQGMLPGKKGAFPSEALRRQGAQLSPLEEFLVDAGLDPLNFADYLKLGAALPISVFGFKGLWSRAERALSKFPERLPANRVMKTFIEKQASKEELTYRGLDKWLEPRGFEMVTRQEIEDFLRTNQIPIEVTRRVEDISAYARRALGPEATNPEALRNLRESEGIVSAQPKYKAIDNPLTGKEEPLILPGESEAYQEILLRFTPKQGDTDFLTRHYPGITNILAHMRTTDRTVGGTKGRMVEEFQSDLMQQLKSAWDTFVREKFNLDASVPVPEPPYKELWPDLMLKQQLLEVAGRSDLNWLGWTGGRVHTKRYDIAKTLDRIRYDPDTQMLRMRTKPIRERFPDEASFQAALLNTERPDTIVTRMGLAPVDLGYGAPVSLADVIGVGLGKKLLSQERKAGLYGPNDPREYFELAGDDLHMPDTAMTEFYDKTLKKRLEKLLAPYKNQGVEILEEIYEGEPIWRVILSDAVKRDILEKGFYGLQEGGAIGLPPENLLDSLADWFRGQMLPPELFNIFSPKQQKEYEQWLLTQPSNRATTLANQIGTTVNRYIPDWMRKSVFPLAEGFAWGDLLKEAERTPTGWPTTKEWFYTTGMGLAAVTGAPRTLGQVGKALGLPGFFSPLERTLGNVFSRVPEELVIGAGPQLETAVAKIPAGRALPPPVFLNTVKGAASREEITARGFDTWIKELTASDPRAKITLDQVQEFLARHPLDPSVRLPGAGVTTPLEIPSTISLDKVVDIANNFPEESEIRGFTAWLNTQKTAGRTTLPKAEVEKFLSDHQLTLRSQILTEKARTAAFSRQRNKAESRFREADRLLMQTEPGTKQWNKVAATYLRAKRAWEKVEASHQQSPRWKTYTISERTGKSINEAAYGRSLLDYEEKLTQYPLGTTTDKSVQAIIDEYEPIIDYWRKFAEKDELNWTESRSVEELAAFVEAERDRRLGVTNIPDYNTWVTNKLTKRREALARGESVSDIDLTPSAWSYSAREYSQEYPHFLYPVHFGNAPDLMYFRRHRTMRSTSGRIGLFLEELQSDWHQRGKKYGYRTDPLELPTLRRQKDEAETLLSKRATEINAELHTYESPRFLGEYLRLTSQSSRITQERRDHLTQLADEMDVLLKEFERLSTEVAHAEKKVPNVPFKETWPELGLKEELLDFAGNKKYEWLGLPTAEAHVRRWGSDRFTWKRLPNGNFKVHYGEISPTYQGVFPEANTAAIEAVINSWGAKEIGSYDDLVKETTAGDGYWKVDPKRAWKRMQEAASGVYEPRREGMLKFYDEELPAKMAKILKPFEPLGAKITRVPILEPDKALSFEAWQAVQRSRRRATSQAAYDEYVAKLQGSRLPVEAWMVELPPEARKALLEQGLPFQQGGVVPQQTEAAQYWYWQRWLDKWQNRTEFDTIKKALTHPTDFALDVGRRGAKELWEALQLLQAPQSAAVRATTAAFGPEKKSNIEVIREAWQGLKEGLKPGQGEIPSEIFKKKTGMDLPWYPSLLMDLTADPLNFITAPLKVLGTGAHMLAAMPVAPFVTKSKILPGFFSKLDRAMALSKEAPKTRVIEGIKAGTQLESAVAKIPAGRPLPPPVFRNAIKGTVSREEVAARGFDTWLTEIMKADPRAKITLEQVQEYLAQHPLDPTIQLTGSEAREIAVTATPKNLLEESPSPQRVREWASQSTTAEELKDRGFLAWLDSQKDRTVLPRTEVEAFLATHPVSASSITYKQAVPISSTASLTKVEQLGDALRQTKPGEPGFYEAAKEYMEAKAEYEALRNPEKAKFAQYTYGEKGEPYHGHAHYYPDVKGYEEELTVFPPPPPEQTVRSGQGYLPEFEISPETIAERYDPEIAYWKVIAEHANWNDRQAADLKASLLEIQRDREAKTLDFPSFEEWKPSFLERFPDEDDLDLNNLLMRYVDEAEILRERGRTVAERPNAYTQGHWETPDTIFHTRRREVPELGKGLHLYVEELQSDPHQAGRDVGYSSPERIAAAKDAYNKDKQTLREFLEALFSPLGGYSSYEAPSSLEGWSVAAEAPSSGYYEEQGIKKLRELRKGPEKEQWSAEAIREKIEQWRVLIAQRNKSHKILNNLREAPPEHLPFKESWNRLAILRELRNAAERGADSVSFSTAQTQIRRWGSPELLWKALPADEGGGFKVVKTDRVAIPTGEPPAPNWHLLNQSWGGKKIHSLQELEDYLESSHIKPERAWKRMMDNPTQGRYLPWVEGMTYSYDKQLPDLLKTLTAPFKGEVISTTAFDPTKPLSFETWKELQRLRHRTTSQSAYDDYVEAYLRSGEYTEAGTPIPSWTVRLSPEQRKWILENEFSFYQTGGPVVQRDFLPSLWQNHLPNITDIWKYLYQKWHPELPSTESRIGAKKPWEVPVEGLPAPEGLSEYVGFSPSIRAATPSERMRSQVDAILQSIAEQPPVTALLQFMTDVNEPFEMWAQRGWSLATTKSSKESIVQAVKQIAKRREALTPEQRKLSRLQRRQLVRPSAEELPIARENSLPSAFSETVPLSEKTSSLKEGNYQFFPGEFDLKYLSKDLTRTGGWKWVYDPATSKFAIGGGQSRSHPELVELLGKSSRHEDTMLKGMLSGSTPNYPGGRITIHSRDYLEAGIDPVVVWDRSFAALEAFMRSGATEKTIVTGLPGYGPKTLKELYPNRFGRAEGGLITGDGTETSDSIPAWLSDGEYVVPAQQTKTWLPVLESIRKGVKKFARGGLVHKAEGGEVSPADLSLSFGTEKPVETIPTEAKTLESWILAFQKQQQEYELQRLVLLKQRIAEEQRQQERSLSGIQRIGLTIDKTLSNSKKIEDKTGAIVNSVLNPLMDKKGAKTEIDAMVNNIKGLGKEVANFGKGLKDLMSFKPGSENTLGTIFGFITMFRAQGGLISGPGTGTSDSIPMNLHYGDHIMPAAKTRTWFPVLEAIRSGTFGRHASGGIAPALVSNGEYLMPAEKARPWLPMLEAIRLGKKALGGLVDWGSLPSQVPSFVAGGVTGPLQSIAIEPVIPVRYAGGGITVTDAGASVVAANQTKGNMTVTLHPETLNMTMREWLEHEVVRQYGRR